jgi:hypothetical protein
VACTPTPEVDDAAADHESAFWTSGRVNACNGWLHWLHWLYSTASFNDFEFHVYTSFVIGIC